MNTTNDAAMVRHNGGAVSSPPHSGGMGAFLDRAQEFYQLAVTIAGATVIPDTFRNRPENVFMALEIASRLQLGVFEVMQSTYIAPGGKLGFESKYAVGLANKRGPFKGPITYEEDGKGDDFTVTAKAIVRETGEVVKFAVSMQMARAEGWAKNGKATKSGKPVGNPKYETMPGLMLRYRAAALLIRTICPEVLLGMHMIDELDDLHASGQGPRYTSSTVTDADPLDAILTPTLDKPDDTAKAIKSAVHVEAKAVQKESPQYAPKKDVDKLAARFEELGVPFEEFAESFGPLDQMTPRTFQEAIEHGRAMAAKQAKAKTAAPTGEMFNAADTAGGYDNE